VGYLHPLPPTVARYFWDLAATSQKSCRYFPSFQRYFLATTTCTVRYTHYTIQYTPYPGNVFIFFFLYFSYFYQNTVLQNETVLYLGLAEKNNFYFTWYANNFAKVSVFKSRVLKKGLETLSPSLPT